MTVETGGKCDAKGASGEGGCLQYMSATWSHHSSLVYGEFRPMTPQRERYVATQMVEGWLTQGYSPAEIALIWNGGNTQIKSGVNKYGVAYDTGAYMRKVLAQLQ